MVDPEPEEDECPECGELVSECVCGEEEEEEGEE